MISLEPTERTISAAMTEIGSDFVPDEIFRAYFRRFQSDPFDVEANYWMGVKYNGDEKYCLSHEFLVWEGFYQRFKGSLRRQGKADNNMQDGTGKIRFRLGMLLLEEGNGWEEDHDRSKELCKEALPRLQYEAEIRHDYESCTILAEIYYLYYNYCDTEANYSTAMQLYEEAAVNGNISAQMSCAVYFQPKQDKHKTMASWVKAVYYGFLTTHPRSKCHLGDEFKQYALDNLRGFESKEEANRVEGTVQPTNVVDG